MKKNCLRRLAFLLVIVSIFAGCLSACNDKEKDDPTPHASQIHASPNWEDCEFVFDGFLFKLDQGTEQLEKHDWHMDAGFQKMKDTLPLMEPMMETPPFVPFQNEKYPLVEGDTFRFNIACGYRNTSEESHQIYDCKLYAIEINIFPGHAVFEKYPDVELSKGIKFGSDIADVIAAYGEPQKHINGDFKEGDTQRIIYEKDGITLSLSFHIDCGLCRIIYKNNK